MNTNTGQFAEWKDLEKPLEQGQPGRTREELIKQGWVELPDDPKLIELARTLNRAQRRRYAHLIQKKKKSPTDAMLAVANG